MDSAGMIAGQIDDRHDTATFTVKSHVRNISEKLEMLSRLQVANYSRGEETSFPRSDRASQK